MHSLLERRSLHSKTCRCAMRTCHNPIALLQGVEDVLAFHSLQNVMKCPVCFGLQSSDSFFWMAGLGKFQISHVDAEGGTRRDNYRALDHILKFSYVPRPMISAQGIHCRRGNSFNHSVHAAGKLLREVPHQERDIPLAFPQGRDVDGKNIQAKEEIGSELLLA